MVDMEQVTVARQINVAVFAFPFSSNAHILRYASPISCVIALWKIIWIVEWEAPKDGFIILEKIFYVEIVCNHFSVAILFSEDGKLELSTKIIIWLFELVVIGVGLVII